MVLYAVCYVRGRIILKWGLKFMVDRRGLGLCSSG
jgi:hypothetical protein